MRLWGVFKACFHNQLFPTFSSSFARSNHLNPNFFASKASNVRSDNILICPPLPFPQPQQCHDDPILNKKPPGCISDKRVARAYLAIYHLHTRVGWGWRGKLLLMRGDLTKAESELLCMEAGGEGGGLYQHRPPHIHTTPPAYSRM